MNMLFRNFFYAVGLTGIFFMYGADPNTVTFSEVVRLVQSPRAHNFVMVVMAALIALELACGGKLRRPARQGRDSSAASCKNQAEA